MRTVHIVTFSYVQSWMALHQARQKDKQEYQVRETNSKAELKAVRDAKEKAESDLQSLEAQVLSCLCMC